MKSRLDPKISLAALVLASSASALFGACSGDDSTDGPSGSGGAGGSSSGGSPAEAGAPSSGGASSGGASSGGASSGGAGLGGEGGSAAGGLGGVAGAENTGGGGGEPPIEPGEIECTGAAEFPFAAGLGFASYEGGLHFFTNALGSEASAYSTPEGVNWFSAPIAPLCSDQRIFIGRRTCEGEGCELAVEYARFEWREASGKLYLCRTAAGLATAEAALSTEVARADDADPERGGCLGAPWQALVADAF